MATPDAIGTCKCGNCSREVYARKNRATFVYYRCEHCSFEGRFHNHRHSEAFIKSRVSPLDDGDEEAGKKPENTAKPAPPPPRKPSASAAPVAASQEDATDATQAKPARARTAAEKFLYGEV